MNALFCCNHVQQLPHCLNIKIADSSIGSRNSSHRPSAVIQTAEGQVATEEAASQSELVARRLILLRHARSSRKNRSLLDHDRPLSKKGKAEAIKVAHKLRELSWIPELILSSDAKRTRETLEIMQEEVSGFSEAEVHFFSSFYSIAAMDGQTAEHLQQAICNYSRNEIITVMCMGHNRGWEEAASMFCGSSIELKTCNAALLEASGKSWDELSWTSVWKVKLKCDIWMGWLLTLLRNILMRVTKVWFNWMVETVYEWKEKQWMKLREIFVESEQPFYTVQQ